MIATIYRIGVLRLRNNPLEIVLMFVVPIIFFSIFALIFGKGIGSGDTSPVKVVFVDLDGSEGVERLVDDLSEQPGIEPAGRQESVVSYDHARELIQTGDATIGIVFPESFGQRLEDDGRLQVEILSDTSDQIATQVVSAMVRQSVYGEQGRIAAKKAEQAAADAAAQANAVNRDGNASPPATTAASTTSNDPSIETAAESDSEPADMIIVRDVLASEKSNPKISMYAAGIAVMFLLFSASGAGGTLLEEQEAGTLERLLSSQLTVSQLLAGKWLFIVTCGTLQLTVMFIWGQLVFGVDLIGHWQGFILMAVATAAAAASLALLLATVCRSRSQLNGVSVILILTMSALGGSMVPRYIMSEELRQYGLLTFNAWALDGFDKVFWRELPLGSLQPQLMVLAGSAIAMAVGARIFATRWEAS